MARHSRRSPQEEGTMVIRSSEIPASQVLTGSPSASPLIMTDSTFRLAAPTATVTATAAPISTPSTSGSNDGLSPGTIVAIVVPIVAVVLLIPMIFLLYRAHQLKEASKDRRIQREIDELMMHKNGKPAEKSQAPQIAPIRAFGVQPPPTSANEPSPRRGLTKSLGLFNFMLSPPQSPTSTEPTTSPLSPPFLSVAQAVPMRKSQPSIVDERRPTTIHSHFTEGRQSFPSWAFDSPSVYSTPQIPPDSHFAPLNQIGVAHSPDIARPRLPKIPSSRSITPRGKPSRERLRPPRGTRRARTQSHSPAANHSIPYAGLDWGSRFTISDYLNRSQRHSEISAISDDDNQADKRMSQQSQLISPVQDNGGTQPFGML